jgi:site-specific DNA-methyltransferase (adenine-specific)
VAELDGQSGETKSGNLAPGKYGKDGAIYAKRAGYESEEIVGDSGGASRFFPTFHYDAKASARERQAGCEGLLWVRDKAAPIGWRRVSAEECSPDAGRQRLGALGGLAPIKAEATGNVHSTIKPIGAGEDDGLMRWLVRLITPPGGRVGDPFLGSGSTAVACQIEGHDFVGCDIDPGAVDIARARTAFWTPERHRLELRQAAALRAEEKRQEEAAARGQLDWTRGL